MCPGGGRGSMTFPHIGVLELCSRMQCGHTAQHEAQGVESAPQRRERLCENILSTCWELSRKPALHFRALTLKRKQRSAYKELLAVGPAILLQGLSPKNVGKDLGTKMFITELFRRVKMLNREDSRCPSLEWLCLSVCLSGRPLWPLWSVTRKRRQVAPTAVPLPSPLTCLRT